MLGSLKLQTVLFYNISFSLIIETYALYSQWKFAERIVLIINKIKYVSIQVRFKAHETRTFKYFQIGLGKKNCLLKLKIGN